MPDWTRAVTTHLCWVSSKAGYAAGVADSILTAVQLSRTGIDLPPQKETRPGAGSAGMLTALSPCHLAASMLEYCSATLTQKRVSLSTSCPTWA